MPEELADMTDGEPQTPKYWRGRAAECRAMAEKARDHLAKETLLKIAEMYDDMAARAAERHKDSDSN